MANTGHIEPAGGAQPPQKTPKKKKRHTLLKLLKWGFISGAIIGFLLLIFVLFYVFKTTRDLPSLETVANYRPKVTTRVHAGDGKLIEEYATEKRVFVESETIPPLLKHAFISAEDQRFYQHSGFDAKGFTRAMLANVGHVTGRVIGKGGRLEGGSTITQQVAKNFLVGNERSIDRKIREIFIARRIEKALEKDEIIGLYLNEIYFGRRSYGIAAASLNYFGKSMDELELHELAYFAALPKGPNNYHPTRKKERAITRRNAILGRMVEDGYISQSEADEAKARDLVVTERLSGEAYLAADYFVEEARKKIFDLYGEEELLSLIHI